MGAYHLAKKSGNFGLRSQGKAIFRKIVSEIVDNLQRCPLFRSEWNSGNYLTICENRSVSRPFLTRSSKYARWNNISKTRASCFTGVSKHEKTDESPRPLGLLLFYEFLKWLLNRRLGHSPFFFWFTVECVS